MSKFILQCNSCNTIINNFSVWFQYNQKCPACTSDYVSVKYSNLSDRLKKIISSKEAVRNDMWRFFDVLPLHSSSSIVNFNEGNVSIERWGFLELFAEKFFGIKLKIYAHRHDNNPATGSFKDLAASMAASVLKEISINNYVLASTGNIGVAYARYLTNVGINATIFIPETASPFKEAEIGCFGQRVYRVAGDYTSTKRFAKEFAEKFDIPLSGSSFDPMRVESKKTMSLQWATNMSEFPTVYLQALSGGTGPIGVYKGCCELLEANIIKKLPRLLLIQSSKCSPMADAYSTAKQQGFLQGWEKQYPVYDNPETQISTLSTGNPTAYPVLSSMVHETEGDILSFNEEFLILIARIVAFEVGARIGPAAAVAVGGFFEGLRREAFQDGDIVMINIGEGIRRDPDFMLRIYPENKPIKHVDECSVLDREKLRNSIWAEIIKIYNKRRRE